MSIQIFHLFINLLLITSAIFVFFSENSVHSIIFLVLTFLNASGICFIWGADFLGLILIVIYVGAIAILFLFVVMLLNVKTQLLGLIQYLPILVIIVLLGFGQTYLIVANTHLNFNMLEPSFLLFDSLSNEFYLGQVLYNYFLICFLLCGIVLLVGMIGAIVLTFNFNKYKRKEFNYRQLARCSEIVNTN